MEAAVPVALVKFKLAMVEEPVATREVKLGVVVTVKVWMPFAVPMARRLFAEEKVCVEEVEPFKEVMPVAEAGSHDMPPWAVEEAVKTKPFVPTVFVTHSELEATIRLPVVPG
jgi:hypothetical protein